MTDTTPQSKAEPAWLQRLAVGLAPPAAPTTLLERGELVDKYQIGPIIGSGGFGVVYRARDLEMQRDVALKLAWRSARGVDPRSGRFSEAIWTAQLSHPYVVTLYDSGVHKGHRFLVFEYLRGESLQARLDKSALDEAEALRVSLCVADALRHAHERHIVHRDLKPDNVFVCDDGTVKLLDFGLAGSLAEGERAPPRGGTPGFMSPEQARGEPGDARSDVFSAGMLLYVCLVGSLARGGVSREVMSGPLARGDLRSLRASAAVKKLLRRATASEPAQRPKDGGEWRACLLHASASHRRWKWLSHAWQITQKT